MSQQQVRVLVTGAGGFIGHHLTTPAQGPWLLGPRASTSSIPSSAESRPTSSRSWICVAGSNAGGDATGVAEVYNLAANMGGIGFIEQQQGRDHARQRADQHAHARGRAAAAASSGTSTRRRRASTRATGSSRPMSRRSRRRTPIRPTPRTATGGRSSSPSASAGTTWRTTASRRASSASTTSSARSGTYDGGREKSPAAICRKVALARDGDEIEVWGDGHQTRSYCYIDDCVEGIYRLMRSDYPRAAQPGAGPTDLHQRAGRHGRRHRRQADRQAVQSDARRRASAGGTATTLAPARCSAGSPRSRLEEGLRRTYAWIEAQLRPLGARRATLRHGRVVGRAAVRADRGRDRQRRTPGRCRRDGRRAGRGRQCGEPWRRRSATIEGWIARGEPHYVCVTGVHGVMESQRDAELRGFTTGRGW